MILLLFLLTLLIIIGIPIGYALGVSGSFYFLVYYPELLMLVPERLFSGFNAPLLLALPLFTLMGLLMNEANLTCRLIDLLMIFVGKIRGALGIATVLVSMIFGGISGSSVSDTASVGAVLIPEMRKKGYSADFACGLTVVSNTMGMIIPPSIPMLLYASITSQSVGKLFMGGVMPGILIAVFLSIITVFIAKKDNIPLVKVNMDRKNIMLTFKEGIVALVMPVFVIGSIVLGIATSTEAAAGGVLYALVVGLFVYRTLKLKAIIRVLKGTVRMSATVMIIIAFSNMYTWMLSLEQIPEKLLLLVNTINLSPEGFLLIFGVIILLAGTFLDVAPGIILLTPVFYPAIISLGISPIQFGVLLIVGSAIGLITPPVAVCINVASAISKMSMNSIFKASLPFLVADLIVMILVCLVPGISTWIPSFFK